MTCLQLGAGIGGVPHAVQRRLHGRHGGVARALLEAAALKVGLEPARGPFWGEWTSFTIVCIVEAMKKQRW